MLKLYDFAPSRGVRVRWTLAELGVDYESVTVNIVGREQRLPAFLAVNPAGKLPVLVDGDFVLTESIAIVLYLAEKYPEAQLLPPTIRGRAEVCQQLLFTTTELEQPLWRMRRHTALYPEDKRLPGDVVLARAEFAAMAQVLEDRLRGRDYLVGDRVSVADFVLAHTLDMADAFECLGELPALSAYLRRMYERPSAPARLMELLAQAGFLHGRPAAAPAAA